MIILEGPDGSGKTTLAEALHEELQRLYIEAPVVHSPGPNEEWLSAVFNYHVANPTQMVIYDRCFFSEFIYGPILRGKVGLKDWLVEYAEKVWIPTIQPLVVFCDVPDEVLDNSVKVKAQMEGVTENIEKIAEAYRNYFYQAAKHGWFPLLKYQWDTTPVSEVVNAVRKHQRSKMRRI